MQHAKVCQFQPHGTEISVRVLKVGKKIYRRDDLGEI